MKNVLKKILIFIAFTAVLVIAVIAASRLVPEPPLKEVELARGSLSEAGRSRADTYSGKLYREARANYDSAMLNWQRENEKFLFFRDYTKVRMFAAMSTEKATIATERSLNNSASLKSRLESKLDTLTSLVSEINKVFGSYPLESETRNRISKGKMLLKESEVSFAKGDYLEAFRKISDSEYLLGSSYETASEQLRTYFKSYSKWRTWADKTIRESKRTGEYSIIIDKFSHRLYVYQKGVKKMEFEAEFGKYWVGDKRVRGDNATPEGMYRVSRKLSSGRTKYHKALLIDYPNAEDMESFRAEVKNGTLPSSARPGGLIEIHGSGGKGTDWTEGCVALTNDEMDAVFKIAKTGTAVTIVGSMTDLHQLLKK